jgi:hypothetical protein
MKSFCLLLLSAVAMADEGTTILIEDFSNPIHKWGTLNDPVSLYTVFVQYQH